MSNVTSKITNVIVVSAGPIGFSATKIENEGKKPQLKFRMICGDQVLADMGEEAARFFTSQVQQAFAIVHEDEWTRCPTYAAVEADRKRIAARNAAV
ncbi:hypothetical protein [Bradyrhizobium elkanii]|uniref:Uncharacterized protein n=1 Tax=Bradyrhizobium diazoefficiens TaxID=1355477 RepID=A0A0E3VX43_9BRAD|nr:hypothetical protein NK6_8866 [Bradyrhizobium diazoefficiens]